MSDTIDSPNEDHWQQWLDWAAGQGITPPAEPAFAAARARVWEASEFAALTAAQSPETFAALLADGHLGRAFGPGELEAQLASALGAVSNEEALGRVLRQFRRRQMLRIVWRDLAGWADLDLTLEDLSALADACIGAALSLLEAWTRAELGVPQDPAGSPQALLVLGMGKLGARELNLSSDIDLIFAFPSAGEVIGGPRALTNDQFFIRLCQRLVRALDAQTADGFVFRVDTRLRPFGDSGPLAMNFDAMEAYYHSQAREWERYAMTKARVVAGPADPAAELAAMLKPFVYRRYLDFGAIESLRALKVMIDRELKRKGMADNVKLGPGGIREIEFIGQSFQLIRGGRDVDLQIRPIQPVLALLGKKGLLDPESVAELICAYRFLRLTENRVQAWGDRQTHLLPADPAGQWRLARSMGYSDWPSFSAVLDGHRKRVQGHFDSVFAGPDEGAAERPLAALWSSPGDDEHVDSQLAVAGFADPTAARSRLAAFRSGVERKGLSSRGALRLAVVMPRLLAEIAALHRAGPPADASAPQPGLADLVLERTLRVLEAVSGRTAYLALLAEHPGALHQLVQLCARSPWFSERTARQPLLLDELLDPRRLYAPPQRAELVAELDAVLSSVDVGDLEQQMERLRQFVHGNILRVAAADVTGVLPLMKVSDYLTEIAETAVARSLAIAWADLTSRHGVPPGTDAQRPGFAVLGYGKLGGLELGYRSDLDLVFIYDDATLGSSTGGERPIAAEQFYVRLGQRLLHIMTTPTYSGVLYDVDMRLRPDGNKGMIARSLASFAAYQSENAWTWEHQALVRARPVAGDAGLGERFAQVRTTILRQPRDTDTLRREVRDMRTRMRENLDKTRGGCFDLKQGRGGIADIEFMVQYMVLRFAAEHPSLTVWTDNIRLLETLRERDLLSSDTAGDLTAAYKALRAAYHRNALRDTPGLVPDGELQAERGRVAALWDEMMVVAQPG